MPSINVSTRALIVGLKAPKGGGKTSAAISEVTGIPARTINHIYTRAVKRGWDPNAWPLELKDEFLADAPRSGRPPKQLLDENGQPLVRLGRKRVRKGRPKVVGLPIPEDVPMEVALPEGHGYYHVHPRMPGEAGGEGGGYGYLYVPGAESGPPGAFGQPAGPEHAAAVQPEGSVQSVQSVQSVRSDRSGEPSEVPSGVQSGVSPAEPERASVTVPAPRRPLPQGRAQSAAVPSMEDRVLELREEGSLEGEQAASEDGREDTGEREEAVKG